MNNTDIWIEKFDNLKHLLNNTYVLNAIEQTKADKKVFDEDKERYKISYIFLRYVLNSYCPSISLKHWKFEYTKLEKPYIINQLENPIYFNLSRSKSLIAVAINRKYKVGIDIEEIKDTDRQLLNSIFTQEEQDYITTTDFPRSFYSLWTLKEAYSKASGSGLNENIKKINLLPVLKASAKKKNMSVQSNAYYSTNYMNHSLACVVFNTKEKVSFNHCYPTF